MGIISNWLYRLGYVSVGFFIDAARKGDREILIELLQRKPDLVNLRNSAGWTAFSLAALAGHKNIAQILISNGADVDARGDGHTALHLVASAGNENIARFLMARGADINARNDDGATPLHCVSVHQAYMPGPRMNKFIEGCRMVARALIDKGAEVNARDNNGWTPLHVSVQAGAPDIEKELLARGADPNAKQNLGSTPLHFALVRENSRTAVIVEMLVGHGADVNAATNSGETPMTLAQNLSPQIAEFLLAEGAKTPEKYNKIRK